MPLSNWTPSKELTDKWNKKVDEFVTNELMKAIEKDIENKYMSYNTGYPWLTKGAVDFLETYLSQSKRDVLEFGAGGSTLWMQDKVHTLVSVEHNNAWIDQIKPKIRSNVFLHHIKRPYFGICDSLNEKSFDLILIDGRDRVGCFFKSLPLLKKGGVIMLDNSEREEYGEIGEHLKNWKRYDATGPDYTGTFNYDGWVTSWWIENEK